ncbi:MAG: single-stranded DNA-binding protein [Planctomycetia bacterium]|nr:single-stranded DNA-binding protein [Planctomycetia bacterium]
MASFNRVILIGNVTRDPELRYIGSGTAVTDLGLAVNDRRKTPSGEWIEEVSFIDVTLWGRTAEVASEHLTKGSPVFIEGRLKQERWEKDGQKHSKVKVVCDRMQLIGGRDGGREGGGREGGSRSQAQASMDSASDEPHYSSSAGPPAARQAPPPPDNDLPF